MECIYCVQSSNVSFLQYVLCMLHFLADSYLCMLFVYVIVAVFLLMFN